MRSILLLLAILFIPGAHAQQPLTADPEGRKTPTLLLRLMPGMHLPIGRDRDEYEIGTGADLTGELIFQAIPLSLNLGASYQLSPIQANLSLSILAAGAGAGVCFYPLPNLSVRGYARSGLIYSFINEEDVSGAGAFFEGGAGFSYLLSRRVGMGIDASYRNLFGLYQGLSCALGISYLLAPAPGKSVDLRDIDLQPVFPVFYKYYDRNPIGTAILRNAEHTAIENIRVSVFVEEHMTNPKTVGIPGKLAAGRQMRIDLYGLFNESVMDISEGTIVSAKIGLDYTIKSKPFAREYVESLRLHNRNALTWDDDRKAAAFVTAKDPSVLKFAKNAISVIKQARAAGWNENFQKAMCLHIAGSLLGLSYVIDPATPYRELSDRQSALDYLQFPRQTLEYRAGDCDDLSILYSALLEATGVETAFITVPGHIFMAFCLGAGDDPSLKMLNPEDLILREEKVWLPVETTEIEGGFLRAWQIAARQWREFQKKGQASFYPVHDAWERFEPVAFSGSEAVLGYPPAEALADRFSRVIAEYGKRQMAPQAAELEGLLKQRPGDAALRNRLAVLYARFGLYDQAEKELNRALERQDYLPALVNLGNLHYLRKEFPSALNLYRRAHAIQPANPGILLSLARLHHELEEYSLAAEFYQRLVASDSGLAAKYDYLDLKRGDPSRATEVDRLREDVRWEEGP